MTQVAQATERQYGKPCPMCKRPVVASDDHSTVLGGSIAHAVCAAYINREDRWVPGCAGTEVPFRKNGRRWLYVYNPATERHGYLCLDTDIVQDRLED